MLIPLDIFKETLQNRGNRGDSGGTSGTHSVRKPQTRLEAWLTFIASDRLEDIMEVIRAYPEFRELYQEVFRFRYQKKELISMYSEALLILDANTVQYMVEEQKKEILELKGDLEMERKASSEKDKEIERLHALLDAQKNI